LGYRRNAGPGTWSVRSTDGHGSDWIKRIALADDLERADGTHVLTYWQAIDQARALARRQEGAAHDESRPLTVAEALDRYESDLKARGGDIYNAKRSRIHLPGSILSKPVALLGATELKRWRDSLAAKGLSPATINRTRTCLRAALELAAEHDKRIGNRREWRVGLRSLPDATVARNVVLDDATVRRIVAAAYDHDRALGLMVEVAATTGARPSEVARVQVADLDLADPSEPRLWIPRSGKGGSRTREEDAGTSPGPDRGWARNAAARGCRGPLAGCATAVAQQRRALGLPAQ
jgi:integrase